MKSIFISIPLRGDEVSLLYTEEIDVKQLGEIASLRRASYVEPTDGGLWTADMGPVNGPVLSPFKTRSEALQAEERWLVENYL
jgi:hypothetical protein